MHADVGLLADGEVRAISAALSRFAGDGHVASSASGQRRNRRRGVNVKASLAVHERTSVLTRPDFYDGGKLLPANIDQIVIYRLRDFCRSCR